MIDITLLEALLERLDELEEKELLNDPKIIEGLMKAREDHVAGKITSHADLIKELGLEESYKLGQGGRLNEDIKEEV